MRRLRSAFEGGEAVGYDVRETSARLLALLGLLQARAEWSATDLADRLGVTDRTVRKDVARLRDLGYPVDAARGPGGRYRLGVGAKLPPLLLDEDEAVAVVVGLRAATGMAGFEEAGGRALTKLEQVLPERLRRRVTALRLATSAGPVNTDSNVEDPTVDPELLSDLAAAVRDHQGLRCDYRGQLCEIEPYHVVSWQRRWYLVGRDPLTGAWSPYRIDWLRLRIPGGRRFTPLPFPGDQTEFVVREVARMGWAVHTRIRVHAPAEEVLARINPAVGTVEAVSDTESILVTGGDSLEVVAVWIGMLGLDFTVTEPPALVEHLHALARRYDQAIGGGDPAGSMSAARARA
jgi:predicted DNA-binding transcriptional regulator YafY